MFEKNIFLLILGLSLSIASIGRFNFPLFIFIWPFCFLFFLHQNKNKTFPLIIVSLCLMVSNIFRWIGIYEGNFLYGSIAGLYYSIINIIPYIIDDIIYDKMSKWASVFVFPLLVAFIEYAFELMPIANHNVYAYALRNNLEIIQICSLFGCYFLSFIIALFASIMDYAYNVYKKEKKISKFINFYIIIIILITSFGTIRLLIPEKEERFNIAATLGTSQCFYLKAGRQEIFPIDVYMDYIQKTIIRANNSEAKIILFAEEAFALNMADRSTIISKTAKLAEKYNIFVVLSLDIKSDSNYLKNEAILISDRGNVLYNYEKKNLIPIMEGEYLSNMTEYKTFFTDLGYLGVVICYDVNFPDYLNRLSNLGLDTLLIPSWDWDALTEFHSLNLRYRAIENGFNTMKSSANGITLSNDYKGRFLSYFQPNKCEDYFIVTSIYKRGTRTLYLYIGKFFNYFYLIVLIILIIIGRKEEKSDKQKFE